MSDEKRIGEAAVAYGVPAVDLSQPVLIRQKGQPVAIIVPYLDYQEFLAWRDKRRQAARKKLKRLLDDIHSRPTNLTPGEIETEITVARQEVREIRRAHHSSY